MVQRKNWRNVVSDGGIEKVSETLDEFRGRQRYVLQDTNVRALYADVPTVAQWDDHETCNNWYPGERLDDDRYTERRCDVLAARGRRAWQEYMPVPVSTFVDQGGDGYASGRIYRKVPRGQHLDLFVLDMRSYRGANDTYRLKPQGILGPAQEEWLTRSVIASRATWKVISADLPLSIPSTHDDDLDGPCNGDDGKPIGREPELARILSAWQRAGVKNVVFITADVHYTAAHHYSPERAAFTGFDPFWEFVSGPLAAETFPRKDGLLDQTFGPQVVFSKGNDSPRRQSPRGTNQFFGHLAIDAPGALTVSTRRRAAPSGSERSSVPDKARCRGSSKSFSRPGARASTAASSSGSRTAVVASHGTTGRGVPPSGSHDSVRDRVHQPGQQCHGGGAGDP